MVFDPLSSKVPGDPVAAEEWNTIKTNFDDHESRIIAVNARVDAISPGGPQYVFHASVTADGTADTIAWNLGLKTDAVEATCDAYLPRVDAFDGTDMLGDCLVVGDGGQLGKYSMMIHRLSYVSGSNSVEIERVAQVSDTGSSAGFVETLSVTADDTWREVLNLNAGGADIAIILLKTDGDTLQWRASMTGFGADPGEARISIVANLPGA